MQREEAKEQRSFLADEQKQTIRDATVHVYKLANNMRAEVLLEGPLGEGAHITREKLLWEIQNAGVVYGLDEAAIHTLLLPTYGKRIIIAQGLASQNGVDGSCTELFERTVEAKFQADQHGNFNYKELGLIRDIPSGTTICEITQPTKGQNGYNILGQSLRGKDGVMPSLPIGEGTRLSADSLRIETTQPGNLVFRNGRFCVDTIYRVEDIDYDVGNITFSGDVIVNGDMQDGFAIRSGGNVTLRGRVGSVTITAAGIIRLEKGINGTNKAVLDAGKTLHAGFIENATIRAKDAVFADSIINSQVECEGDVKVTTGRGLICGGNITALGSVTAKEIGNDFYTHTTIALGITPRMLDEKKKLEQQLADIQHQIQEMVKNAEYITLLMEQGKQIPQERIKILQSTKIRMPLSERKKEQLKIAIESLEKKMAETDGSVLAGRIIHPPTRVIIGSLTTAFDERKENCRVYRNQDGEIAFGSYS